MTENSELNLNSLSGGKTKPTSSAGKIIMVIILLLILIGGGIYTALYFMPEGDNQPPNLTAILSSTKEQAKKPAPAEHSESQIILPSETEQAPKTPKEPLAQDITIEEAPESMRTKYSINGLGKGPEGAYAIINGTMVSQGEEIKGGAIIQEITKHYVIIGLKEKYYRLRQQ